MVSLTPKRGVPFLHSLLLILKLCIINMSPLFHFPKCYCLRKWKQKGHLVIILRTSTFEVKHGPFNIHRQGHFFLLLHRIDIWWNDELIVRWREHPLTVRNDELSWSCSLYREGLWRHRVLAWEMLYSDCLSSTSVNIIHVLAYGLRWVFEKTAYI